MYRIGDRDLVFEGPTTVERVDDPEATGGPQHTTCITIEDDKGHPCMMIGTGALVPENWIGRRVRITVSLAD